VITKDIQLSEFLLQTEEVQAVKWASLEEIVAMIDSGEFIPYHKDLIGLLFFMRNHRGTFIREDVN
jgi:isopentenyldiphosphate isomerase